MELVNCPDRGRGRPAEVLERWDFASTDGPAPHAKRRVEYGRLDDGGHVYLDYTDGGLHAASQIEEHSELMRSRVLGNPHSNSPASLAATDLVDCARRLVREFFDTPPDDYSCVFTANASAALRLVGESYRFALGDTFALTADNHNSVNGIRGFARRTAFAPTNRFDVAKAGSSALTRSTAGSSVSCSDSCTGRWPISASRHSPPALVTLAARRRDCPVSNALATKEIRHDEPVRIPCSGGQHRGRQAGGGTGGQ